MKSPKPNVALRLASMLLDHLLLCFAFVIPLIALNFIGSDYLYANGWGPLIQLGLFLMLILYFLKDSFNGRSVAKRITKLQVLNNTTGEVASVSKCFLRNVFIIVWPVEVLVSLFSPARRIGYFVAGTKVIMYAVSTPAQVEDF